VVIPLDDRIVWLLTSDEPWTKYRALVDLLELPEGSVEVEAARDEMLNHPQVQQLIENASGWPGYALKRHNDANHPMYKLSTLADFGLKVADEGLSEVVKAVLSHQSPEGAFESQILIPKAFGGSGQESWSWILCDSPTLLYSLLAMGLTETASVQKAGAHLIDLVEENGWRCSASPDLGKFKGPGKRSDPCPIANVYALKALSQTRNTNDNNSAHIGTEMLLNHWQIRRESKFYLFGMGTDFSKLKYPFVWYDILHVADVLSRFPWVHSDPRFIELLEAITAQADSQGRYTASSMYLAWKDWSFADKKRPSAWITLLVLRIQKRAGLGVQ
jgi:hypothetical protein